MREVIERVLTEHRLDGYFCDCGHGLDNRATEDEAAYLHAAHQAEMVAAHFEQVGWWNDDNGYHDLAEGPDGGIHEYDCYLRDVPVWRLRAEGE